MLRLMQNLGRRWTLAFFARQLRHCRNRKEPKADANGFERIEFVSGDQTVLRGWIYRTSAFNCSSGTVILTHGTADNSASVMWGARELSEAFGLVAMSLDHRMHGLSGANVPSFGAHGKQIWEWEGSSRLRREFYARVLASRAGAREEPSATMGS